MKRMERVGRNEECPCGSGKKFKRCCESKTEVNRTSRVLVVAVVGAVAGAILIGLATFRGDQGASRPRQVWDPAHGHYHDVP